MDWLELFILVLVVVREYIISTLDALDIQAFHVEYQARLIYIYITSPVVSTPTSRNNHDQLKPDHSHISNTQQYTSTLLYCSVLVLYTIQNMCHVIPTAE